MILPIFQMGKLRPGSGAEVAQSYTGSWGAGLGSQAEWTRQAAEPIPSPCLTAFQPVALLTLPPNGLCSPVSRRVHQLHSPPSAFFFPFLLYFSLVEVNLLFFLLLSISPTRMSVPRGQGLCLLCSLQNPSAWHKAGLQ